MKGNFWRKIFRHGYGVDHGISASHYNGNMAKTDANTSRAKLKRFLNNLSKSQEDIPE